MLSGRKQTAVDSVDQCFPTPHRRAGPSVKGYKWLWTGMIFSLLKKLTLIIYQILSV